MSQRTNPPSEGTITSLEPGTIVRVGENLELKYGSQLHAMKDSSPFLGNPDMLLAGKLVRLIST